jgi:NADPH:quinone reductase-like Zn-dependent oxidoreductase
VLIHSASGGIGIAAIQVSQMIGATIYATVSNDEKAQHLEQHYGIPENHIFQSRDSSFLHGVLKATNGKGVDLVLNSLTGELFESSCQCVAAFGRMIDLAKGNASQARSFLSCFPTSNVGYTKVDMTDYIRVRPEECQRYV